MEHVLFRECHVLDVLPTNVHIHCQRLSPGWQVNTTETSESSAGHDSTN